MRSSSSRPKVMRDAVERRRSSWLSGWVVPVIWTCWVAAGADAAARACWGALARGAAADAADAAAGTALVWAMAAPLLNQAASTSG